MKIKFLILLFSIMTCNYVIHGQVYQLPNGGFELWDSGSDESEPNFWNAFPSSSCDLSGVYSLGCNTATAIRHSKSTDIRPGSTGAYSCKLFATQINLFGSTIIANGTITTGQIRIGHQTATSPENYNITRTNNSDFKQVLNAKPDSLVFWAKFECPSATQNAKLSAIVHINYDYRDPEESDTQAPTKVVGKAVHYFTRGNQNWKRYSVPFDYNHPASTEAYILITFTTNMNQGVGSASDVLYVDDVELIYNTLLSDIQVNGNSLPNFNPTIFDYTIELECGLTSIVSAISQSPNASINISQAGGLNPAIITVNSGGQTSIYRIYFNYSILTHVSDIICRGDSYTNYGFDIQDQNNTGVFTFTRTTFESELCDSVIILSLDVKPSFVADTADIMICEGSNYDFYGRILSEHGIYDTIIPTIFGCDSLVTLKLSVGDFYRIYVNAEICEGEIYSEHGFYANQSGTDTLSYTAINSCDSIVILNLAVNPIYNIQILDSIYEGYSYVSGIIETEIFDIPGTYSLEYQLFTENFCDSIVNIELIVLELPLDSLPYELNDLSFSIYPNPAHDEITVKSDLPFNYEINYIIYDMFGKIVISGEMSNTETKLNIEGLASGIYFLKIINYKKNKSGFKFFVF